MKRANDVIEALPEAVPAPPPRSRRRRLVAGVLLVLLLGGTVAGVVMALRGSGKKATSLPSRPVPLDDAARELVALMVKGQEGVYHASYRTVAPAAPGTTLTVEIWRRGSLTRQDTVASDGTRTIHTAGFTLPSGDRACRREQEGAWSCIPVNGARTTTDELTSLAIGELSGRHVTARDETIAGRRARCFTIAGEGQSSDLCLSPDGVALLVGTDNTRLELVALDAKVNDAVFRPPA